MSSAAISYNPGDFKFDCFVDFFLSHLTYYWLYSIKVYGIYFYMNIYLINKLFT